jgi:hypothetical protein
MRTEPGASRLLVVVNAVFVIACVLPFALGPLRGVALWLAMASVVFVNALFHIRGSIQTGQSAPGVITSVLLYIPLSTFGHCFFLSSTKRPPAPRCHRQAATVRPNRVKAVG